MSSLNTSEESSEDSKKINGNETTKENRRAEELQEIRRAQLAALKREYEMKQLQVTALRSETKERVEQVRRLMDAEILRRKDPELWSGLVVRKPEMTNRVRAICDKLAGPKKSADAKKIANDAKMLLRELEDEQQKLAITRATFMRERGNEESVEEVRTRCPQTELENQDGVRSCATCGYRSSDGSESDDDTLAGYQVIPGDQSPNSGPQAAFRARFGAADGTNRVQIIGPSGSPASTTSGQPHQNGGLRAQYDSDHMLAMALQQAEFRQAGGHVGPNAAPIPGHQGMADRGE